MCDIILHRLVRGSFNLAQAEAQAAKEASDQEKLATQKEQAAGIKQLKALHDQAKALHEQVEAKRAEKRSALAAFHVAFQDGNLDGMKAALQVVVDTKTAINGDLAHLLALLKQVESILRAIQG
jgi:hypothetical protein